MVTRQTLAAQQSTVKGRVVNSSGEPLIGVTVYSKDNKRGVATDIDGNFSIRVGSGKTSLQFTYVGYKPETVPVKNRDFIAVTMEEDSHMLNEVVAVGYGVMRKSDLTGSVTRVGVNRFYLIIKVMHGRCSVTEIQGKEFIDHFVCIRLSIIIQFHRRIEIELLPDSTQENTSHTILGIHLYLIGPDIEGAHTVNERLGIESTLRTYDILKKLVAQIATLA